MALEGIRLTAAICLFSVFTATFGSYVIMVPKSWELGGLTQICVVVDDPHAPSGEITLAASAEKYNSIRRDSSWSSSSGKPDYEKPEEDLTVVYMPPTSIPIPPGKVEICQDLSVNDAERIYGRTDVSIKGNVAGSHINLTANIQFGDLDQNTIIQTDKYLYQPGQLVQFRILTHYGPLINISTQSYPEVWVTSPSRTRIAQWKNVDNSAGLVHLEMQLVDEPEEGSYQITVKTDTEMRGRTETTHFKVEEYVLPRFEVTIEPPKYVLARDPGFFFKVCAKYTFGQPVDGDLSVKISNNGNKKCYTVITRNETLSGCKEFEVSSSDMRTLDCNINSVFITATVAEKGTGVELGEMTSIPISRNAVSFKTLYHDRYMKNNLPYALKVQAKLPDESPAADVPVEMCYDGSCTNITTPADGIIKVHVRNFDSRRVLMRSLITRAGMRDSPFSTDIERYFSPSNSSLTIYASEGELECEPGEVTQAILPVLFSTPDLTSAKFSVQVISRDRIQFWASDEYSFQQSDLPYKDDYISSPRPISTGSGTTGVIKIPLKLPSTVAPSAWVLVWYIRDDGEVVSDSRQLKMEKCLPNKVNLRWSATEAQPGEQAAVHLSSEPNSLCSLGVVDKSVELLTPKSNALTLDTFFSAIDHYNYNWRHRSQINDYQYCRKQHSTGSGHGSYYTDYVDALKMFDDSGLFIFSDLQLETRPCEKQESRTYDRVPYRSHSRGGGHSVMSSPQHGPMSADRHYSATSSVNEEITVTEEELSSNPRTEFPETWLWDLVLVPPQGVAEKHVTMPDTITEWVGKAVCVHPQKGVGLSERVSITTFTPFFIDVTLPPSIKRGEILPVKISVFNYMENQLPVTVLLEESVEYEVLGTATESLCLDASSMEVHAVRIRPSVIGDVNITVTAFVDHRSCGPGSTDVQKRDSMVRPIKVEAEGFPREKTWTKYICSDELTEDSDSLENWEVSAPSPIVEGSDRGWVMAVGDLLALSVENLGHLIRMPYGCGEQNMLNFAPNIFILKYLDATDQNAPEAKEKLLKFMKTGYQRQLLYLRSDGSFSAFGNADASGSTWLTAFVLKSLAQAKDYIMIDNLTINMTMEWLQKAQGEKGCYQSIGTLFNKAMRGGIREDGSSVPLTAYVMISLLESGEMATMPSVSKAAQCLRDHSTQNPYEIALKAYAFAMAEDPVTELLLDQLLALSTDLKTSMHWELPQSSWRSRSLEVETAGYTILAMLKSDALKYEQQIRKIVKWISSQRNGQGGFISTQDTVVALQAMARFEAHLDRGTLDAVISVKTADLTHSFSIKESNKLVQQQVSIPSLPTTVFLDVTGEGCVLMQAVLRYNIPDPEPSDAFSLSVRARTVTDKNCITKQMHFCVSYLLPGDKSNMAVIEINLVSGYIPEKDDLKKLVKDPGNAIKRYEVDGSRVSLYVEELTGEELCGNIRLIREVNVEEVKPGSVVVYDYYQPEFSLSKSYKLPPPDECY